MTLYPHRELTITSKVQECCGWEFAGGLGEFDYSKSLVAPSSSINATLNVNVVMSAEPLVDVESFSSFSKALRVTTPVFKVIFRMRKSKEGPGSTAGLHLLQHMQKDCFPNELVNLSLPDCDKPKDVSNLVNNLDLFLDDKGLIRSRGCIAKSL